MIFQDVSSGGLAGVTDRERIHPLICSLIKQFITPVLLSPVNYSVLSTAAWTPITEQHERQ